MYILIVISAVDDGCLGSQCANDSTCVPLSDKGYSCQCPPGQRGKLCDQGKVNTISLHTLASTAIYVVMRKMFLIVCTLIWPSKPEH